MTNNLIECCANCSFLEVHYYPEHDSVGCTKKHNISFEKDGIEIDGNKYHAYRYINLETGDIIECCDYDPS